MANTRNKDGSGSSSERSSSGGRREDGNARGGGALSDRAKIPNQPRDCGPHVDTWPILDEQAGDAPTPKSDEHGIRGPQAPARGTA